MAQGLTNQIVNSVPGMEVVAIFNRQVERARDVFRYAGRDDAARRKPRHARRGHRQGQAGRHRGRDAARAQSPVVDVLVDVTGAVELGAHVVLEAFAHGKDVVLMNAEIDATIGPILQVHATKAGVVLTACEGDEPGVELNLYRWVKGLG